MSRHSKNNTASSVFTYYERKQLKYGTQTERLGSDSLKPFDNCGLCLHPAIDPLACSKGNIYCKECIYSFLLNQKKEINRQLEAWEAQEKRLKEEEELKQQENFEQEVGSFERAAYALPTGNKKEPPKEPPKEKLKLSAFWMPGIQEGMTGHAPPAPTLLKKPSLETKCPRGYPLRLKKLVKLNFTENKNDDAKALDVARFQCPACCKSITNAVKSVALKKCGHVLCEACFKAIKKDSSCFVCGKKFKERDVLALESEGTGYAESSGEKLKPRVFSPTAWL